ncbi:MAG TPA: DinB family protein [Vicinamibacteria bacterium]|nr:DinB family protein [Vicinamibacteria bacterium]
MLDHIRRLFRYDRWANAEALAAAGDGVPRAARLVAHVLGAEWLWLSRLRGRPSPAAVWPEWGATACAEEMAALTGEWDGYLDGLDEAGLKQPIAYVNSKGERWTNTVEDVLLHVLLHSAYHRGQAATEMRAGGGVPAYTDYIHAVRQRLIE